MQQLPIFLNLRGTDVVLVGNGEGREPKQRLLEAAGANIVAVPTAQSRIAVVAVDDERAAARVAGDLRAAGLLVNVVDKPKLCDFGFPAIVDRAPVTVAIGTGGASATLSKALRERLEALLPAGLGAAAETVRRLRGEVNAAIPKAARRPFWDRLFAPGGALDPLGDNGDADAAIRAAMSEDSVDVGTVTVIAGKIEADDLTLRELRALSQADIVLVEPGASEEIAGRARRDAERVVFEEDVALPKGRIVVVRR